MFRQRNTPLFLTFAKASDPGGAQPNLQLLEGPLNLEKSEGSHLFDETRLGRAGELVPAWVEEVLG